MITSFEAFQKRVKIGDSFFIVPIEVLKEMERLDSENEELRANLMELEAQVNADEFEKAKMIITNLQSDRAGIGKKYLRNDISILSDEWAEIEGRIVHALRGETLSGTKYTPDMLPKVFGADAEEFIRARRANQMLNRQGIEVSSIADDEPSDPKERRKKRAEVTRIE